MSPRVIIHTTVSLDGATTGYDIDIGLHYEILLSFGPDALLVGSTTARTGIETFLDITRPEGPADLRRPEVHADDPRPIGVFVDSRGVLKGLLHFYRQMEHIKDVVVLVSEATPDDYIAYLRAREYPFIRCGTERVDLKEALDGLGKSFGVSRVVTDSGGGLSGALIAAGVADEVSLVVTPGKRGGGVHETVQGGGRARRPRVDRVGGGGEGQGAPAVRGEEKGVGVMIAEDDEPLSDEESLEDIRAGRLLTLDRVRAELREAWRTESE
ncbi:dihydrofolate reductase family protein [uncultured Methanofollis sp.]|uniref:dihydrofolate reductase family protein n=1 Tax=uncultured Methanofollis sp. TaxID=262500 RepID=UPI00263A07A5|nr:dihydrofolate reductase family protein [uncultured Methanofollis sp.]